CSCRQLLVACVTDAAATENDTVSLHDALPIYNEGRIAYNEGVAEWWFLRSPGGEAGRAADMSDVGTIILYGDCTNAGHGTRPARSEEHTSELQSRFELVCRLLLEKKQEDDTKE